MICKLNRTKVKNALSSTLAIGLSLSITFSTSTSAFAKTYNDPKIDLGIEPAIDDGAPTLPQDPFDPNRTDYQDRPSRRDRQNRQNNGNNQGNNNQNNNQRNVDIFTAADPVIQGMSCPLVDSRPNQELMKALDSLQRAIVSTPDCKDNKSVDDMARQTQALKQAATELKTYWESPESASNNIPAFEAALSTAIQGVVGLGDTLNNNSLLNSRCGKQMMTSGQALLAFSDVVNGIAPFALLAGTMSTSLKAAIPYVVGVVGVASVFKIIGSMADKNTLDMTKYEHRQAVLQNTCEYSKIAQKIRFIKLAQSGQIQAVTEELKALNNFLTTSYNPQSRLAEIIDYRDKMLKIYNRVSVQLSKDRNSFRSIGAQISKDSDAYLLCSYGKTIAKQAKANKKFPNTAINNYNYLAKISKNSYDLTSEALLAHEESARRALQNIETDNIEQCSTLAKSWISSIGNLIKATDSELSSQMASLGEKLNSDREFKSWNTRNNQVEKDRDTLKQVVMTIEKLNQDESVIARSEMHQRMSELKGSLFGINKTFSIGDSPVKAWLNHTFTVLSRSLQRFESSWMGLRAEAFRMTDSGAILYGDKKGPETCIWFFGLNNCKIYTPADIRRDQAKYAQDVQAQNTLAPINAKSFPLGSKAQEIACKRLEHSWLNWAETLDHLGAAYLFCDTIRPLLDDTVDQAVLNYCIGKQTISGKQISPPALAEKQSYLVKHNYKAAALLISQKMKDIQCALPEVSNMEQNWNRILKLK